MDEDGNLMAYGIQRMLEEKFKLQPGHEENEADG